MQLSPHFKLEEFTRSGTAIKYGIKNEPNAEQIANLKALCENVLEPLRQHFFDDLPPKQGEMKGVFISSGYRSPTLNNHPEVRGATNSQHMKGEAADLRIPSLSEGRRWMEWLISNLSFDQCIMEHCKNKDGSTSHWIHVSYSRNKNRQYVISSMWKN